MYGKYHTDALVLGFSPQGEADARVTLFTAEFGLIRARASAARRESSRMRYGLQTYTRSRISLVRGSTGWRAAGAIAESFLSDACPPARAAFARIARLTIRLVPGEESNQALFLLLEHVHEAFKRATPEQCALIELVCVARILHVLGYLSLDALGSALFVETVYEPHMLERIEAHKITILTSVNRALTETHL